MPSGYFQTSSAMSYSPTLR